MLEWRDRSGVLQRTASPASVYRSPRLSPDETFVAVSLLDQAQTAGPDIWTLELARTILTRLTSDARNDWFPVWSSDGARVFFSSTRFGSSGLFQKVPTGSAPDEALTEPSGFGRYSTDTTKGGDRLVFHEVARDGYDLGVMTTAQPRQFSKFLATPFNEVQGRLAPNERWLAYASDESGRFEVYVRPFPSGMGQWTISVSGGMQPEWRSDGKELFYLSQDGQLMSVPVTTDGATFSAEAARALFRVEVPEPSAPYPTDYTVSRDGQRFLINSIVTQPVRPSLTLILNWAAGLQSEPRRQGSTP
jgi:Tol biopolymer transport system component